MKSEEELENHRLSSHLCEQSRIRRTCASREFLCSHAIYKYIALRHVNIVVLYHGYGSGEPAHLENALVNPKFNSS